MNDKFELPESGYVTGKRVKERYDISNSTLYQWIADQRLPAPVKIGPRAVRFRVEDLHKFETSLASNNEKEE